MTAPRGLAPLEGHVEIRSVLARAALAGSLPGSVLLHGPAGVGKQRLALWLGQLLLCESPGEDGPCDACRPCRMARRLEHPDLIWFFPLPRPKGASSPERLAEALEDARAEELEARRTEPLHARRGGELTGIYLAQVHTIRRLAVTRPAMASRKVFVIGDAESMVPQEASQEAANAFLKLLEEPPADSWFLLTAADPAALLPTIRSRVLGVRVPPLAEETAASFLAREAGVPFDRARLVARLAGGSIGSALGYLPAGKEPGRLERLRRQGLELLEAALEDGAGKRLAAAHGRPPAGARGEFTDLLDALEAWVRDLAAVASGPGDEAINRDELPRLRSLVARTQHPASGALDALGHVAEARRLAGGNVNPQLLTAWLLRAVGEALRGPPASDRVVGVPARH